jgi:hypothetical protein
MSKLAEPDPRMYSAYTVFSGREFTKKYQRGLSEAQNGYTFCMLLGQVALTCRFQAQLCNVDFKDLNAAELETCNLEPPASAAAA